MNQPLAYKMRPQNIDEIIGQKHLVGENKILRKCVEQQKLFSMIFFGPPGTGKTTLAMVLSHSLHRPYRLFNAVTGNKKELDAIFEEAKLNSGLVVIVDEVHRLNKDKQDLLLPHIENGNIILIGATTANPYHSINPAIRSRTHIFEVKALQEEDIEQALRHALVSEKGYHNRIQVSESALHLIAKQCNGDIRFALNLLELCAFACENNRIDETLVLAYAQKPNLSISKEGDGHYDILSALQKSIRGSDVDAALYYLAILIASNDMESIERRLITIAYEDIGLANPAACARCMNAIDGAKRIGFPEARIPLANAVIDLCLSPKSKSAEKAIDAASASIQNHIYPMTAYLRYTPVGMSKEDQYDYNRSDLWSKIQYLPDAISTARFYVPNLNSQYEKVLAMNLEKLKKNKRSNQMAQLKKDL
ncbi:MAG: replication-associated recombination protein A [Erysipelotrichia bacterium]|nr:replication-associated recombination protein A [Erysipelotrichia bacterium]NCC54814.1 replication-associated recombination protein A [Erysipelotrichia bacterium]